MPNMSVFRPGLIESRKDARFGERCLSVIPFLPKIKSQFLAAKILNEAESALNANQQRGYKMFTHSEILKLPPVE